MVTCYTGEISTNRPNDDRKHVVAGEASRLGRSASLLSLKLERIPNRQSIAIAFLAALEANNFQRFASELTTDIIWQKYVGLLKRTNFQPV
jgi:hypothetical protein